MSLEERRRRNRAVRWLLVFVGLALVGAMLYELTPLLHQWWGRLLHDVVRLVRRLFGM